MRPHALGASYNRRLPRQKPHRRLSRSRKISRASDGLSGAGFQPAAIMSSSQVDQLQATLASSGPDAALSQAAVVLRQQKKYHELFEVLKMGLRRKLGLPLLASDATEGLTDEQRTKLEDGLIGACREVGSALLSQGQIREGWMYLRPVGDKAEAAKLLGQIEATDDTYEDLIDVCLHEGI